jgi:hypothetical protein
MAYLRMTRKDALERLELLKPDAYGTWPDKTEMAYVDLKRFLGSKDLVNVYDPEKGGDNG